MKNQNSLSRNDFYSNPAWEIFRAHDSAKRPIISEIKITWLLKKNDKKYFFVFDKNKKIMQHVFE